MDQMRHQIRRAKRRLLLDRVIQSVTWTTFVTLLVALIAIAIPKFWPLGLPDGSTWAVTWLIGALVFGLTAGVFWAVFRQQSDLNAAIEIDLRYGLKERVSSALALRGSELESEAGQALLDDARRRVARIDVREHFRPHVNWHPLLPLLTAVCAFLIAFLVQDAAHDVTAARRTDQSEQIRKSVAELKKRLEERKKKAVATGLKDADTVITKMQRAIDELSKKDPKRKKVLVKLNNISKELRERREGLSGSKKTRDILKQLQSTQRGPAKRITDALKKGDMEKAMKELKSLSKKLRDDELTPEEKAQLAKQLEELRKELDKMLGARQELAQKQKELQKQIDQLKKQGKHAQAGELQQRMDQLQKQMDAMDRQNPQMEQLQKLADKLGQCAQCVKQGNGQKAADQLDKLANDLQQMRDQLDSLQTLDEMMNEIADAKNAMNCDKCGGAGCDACQGMGMGGADGFSEKPGNGLGKGNGFGDRPEEETKTGGYRARVAGDPHKGEAIRVGDASGANVAGQSREQVKEEIASSFSEDPAPLTHQKLPRREREQTREYFERLRKGD